MSMLCTPLPHAPAAGPCRSKDEHKRDRNTATIVALHHCQDISNDDHMRHMSVLTAYCLLLRH